MKKFVKVGLIVAAVFFLGQTVLVYGLTDKEMLRLSDESFAKGEISEKVYNQLKAKYSKVGEKEAKPVAVEEVPGNVFKNASFEIDTDDDGMPDDWEKHQPQKGYFGLDTEVFHSGKSSFSLSCEKLARMVGITQTATVTGGKKYQFTCWLKGKDLASAFPATEKTANYVVLLLQYTWLDSNSASISNESFEFINIWSPKTAFKRLQRWTLVKDKVRTAPANAVAVQMFIGMYRVDGTCWYDDVVLRELD